MKIALCGRFNTDVRHQGGSSEVMLVFAKYLSKKHEVTLFGRGKPTKEIVQMCTKSGIKYHYIPSDTIINILLGPFRALVLLHRHFDDFDIIHSHNGSYAIASVFFKKRAVVMTHVHEVLEAKYNNTMDTIYLFVECTLLRIAAKSSHTTITVSKYMENLLEERWRLKNVKVIQNGTDTNIFRYSKNQYIDGLYGKGNYKTLYIGRLTERKGVLELIDSFQYLKSEGIKLLIVGYGGLESEVIKKISAYKNMITLISYVKQSKLADYYSSADLVIIPSKYEPSPLVAKEAMACGTPILVGRNSGLKELKNAYFINDIAPKPIANMILELKEMRLPSRKFYRDYIVKNFTWDKSIESLESLYEKALVDNKEDAK